MSIYIPPSIRLLHKLLEVYLLDLTISSKKLRVLESGINVLLSVVN
jgi:hypothetical protein